MDKRKAIKIVSEGEYLLSQTVTLKIKNKNGALTDDQFLIESFGAAKISYSFGNSPNWYEVWANLKSVSTGKTFKMRVERLIQIFPNK